MILGIPLPLILNNVPGFVPGGIFNSIVPSRDGALTFTQASLGAKVSAPSLDGAMELKIPPGTKPGTLFKIRGKGMPRINSRSRGDEYVKINLTVPTELTKKQKELLIELEKVRLKDSTS